MDLARVKIAELPVVRVQYVSGACPDVTWKIGDRYFITRYEPSDMMCFEELRTMKKDLPDLAVWCFTNVPSLELDSQISVLLFSGEALVFEFHVREDPRWLNREKWDDILETCQLVLDKCLAERPTIH